jgi:hypothetical protein
MLSIVYKKVARVEEFQEEPIYGLQHPSQHKGPSKKKYPHIMELKEPSK